MMAGGRLTMEREESTSGDMKKDSMDSTNHAEQLYPTISDIDSTVQCDTSSYYGNTGGQIAESANLQQTGIFILRIECR